MFAFFITGVNLKQLVLNSFGRGPPYRPLQRISLGAYELIQPWVAAFATEWKATLMPRNEIKRSFENIVRVPVSIWCRSFEGGKMEVDQL